MQIHISPFTTKPTIVGLTQRIQLYTNEHCKRYNNRDFAVLILHVLFILMNSVKHTAAHHQALKTVNGTPSQILLFYVRAFHHSAGEVNQMQCNAGT